MISSIWYNSATVVALAFLGGITDTSSSDDGSFLSLSTLEGIVLAMSATLSDIVSCTLSFFFRDDNKRFCFADPNASTKESV